MPDGTLFVDESVLAQVGRWYRGKGLTVADCAQMGVEAIADRFEVHANSIHLWARRFEWQRPIWYRPSKRSVGGDPQAQRDKLLDLLRGLVGQPTPSDGHFGKALGCSGMTASKRLNELRAAGELQVERSGCRRRFILKDGQTTGWTARRREAHLTMARLGIARTDPMPVERKKKRLADILAALRAAADRNDPCPDNAELGRLVNTAVNHASELVGELAEAGHFTIERQSRARRVIFPDGSATSWPLVAARSGVVDVVARVATVSLQRRGLTTFDCGIYGGNWGERWCVDGKIVDRAGLLACANPAVQALAPVKALPPAAASRGGRDAH